MKVIYRLTPIFLFLSLVSHSQNLMEAKTLILKDSISSYIIQRNADIRDDSINSRILSPKAFDRYFDNYFTLLNYDRETFTEGNSAALRITDNATKMNLALSHKGNNYIFTVGTVLNVKDGSGTLFSGDKPTSGTQFFINHSFLFKQRTGGTFLGYDVDARDENFRKRRLMLDSIETAYVIKNYPYLKVMNARLAILNDSISLLLKLKESSVLDESMSLKYSEILVSQLEKREKLKLSIDAISFSEEAEEKYEALKNSFDDLSMKTQLATKGINFFRLKWFTFGTSYKRDNYSTYDSTLLINKRIDEKPFDNWSFNGIYHFYWQRNEDHIKFRKTKGFNSFYANISYSAGSTNNYVDLKEASLTIAKTFQQNDTIYQFRTDQKLRDISKKPFKSFWQHRLGAQATGMLGMKQFIGINASANVELSNQNDPKFNTRLGVLFRFVDSENQKSKVNFELFLSLNDLTDVKKRGKSVWQRKEIGVSASVPFQKVFFR